MQAWVYGVLGVLWLTGMVWLGLRAAHAEPGELDSWSLRIHGAAAMGSLLIFGILLPTHSQPAWNRARNRVSGGLVIGTATLLVASGYGLYYFGDEALRRATSIVHSIVGGLLPAAIVAHVVIGRRSRRMRPPAGRDAS